MSHRLIALNPDLLRLRNEGYDVAIVGGYVLVRDVPYVDASRTIKRGVLISKLELSGDKTNKPNDHVAQWVGEQPCHADGTIIGAIAHSAVSTSIGDGIVANFMFSAKADYRDYHHKLTTYIGRIAGEAAKLDPSVTPKTFPAIAEEEGEGVFKYVDTASSRANIAQISAKLASLRIGILGLGGTGSYVLDFVAKTCVKEIHLYDGDVFSQHNAFRSPGAPTLQQLQERPQKVNYHASLYSNMRNGIVPHEEFLCEANLSSLDGLDFVFICLDQGQLKRAVVERLAANQIPFVDTGMGVDTIDGQLGGIVRAVQSTPENREAAAPHISYADANGANNEYATNIQIAELNAMNAVMAVMLWKKHYGVYEDTSAACYFGYSIRSGATVIDGME